jgi:thiamine biosynthesis lipoprotein
MSAKAMARASALAALLALALAPPVAAAPVKEIHYTMGTYFSIEVGGLPVPVARRLMRRCFAEARRLESVFSRFDPNSELRRLNARGGGVIEVSADMAELLRRSQRLSAATGGTFDVTIGSVTRLWRTAARWPAPAAVAAADAGDAAERVRFDGERRLRLATGVQLDFDGVAKGYAVDRCVALLRAGGVRHALLSLGESSQYAIGAPAGARAWSVAVRDLSGERALGTLRLRDRALSVSSALGHQRRIGARRVGHIVDPRSGQPLTEPAAAVVIATSATDAEAWSKALLLAGHGGAPDAFEGALRITPGGVQRLGSIAFRAFDAPRPIAAGDEPLR